MSLTAMDAPKPMRQPASTEKNGPPNHGPIGGILGLPPPTNLANHTPPRIGPTGSTRSVATNPDRSQPAGGGSKRLTLLQASILVAPIAGAEHVRNPQNDTPERRDPHPGTRVPTSGKRMAAPRDASKSDLGAGRGKLFVKRKAWNRT